jgi:hypothetical protein
MSLYTVMVDDNFHYMDAGERWQLGTFETEQEAVAACKKIIDEWLALNHKPGMLAAELYGQYTTFGDDPYVVVPEGAPPVHFSAHEYAHGRVQAMCPTLPPQVNP